MIVSAELAAHVAAASAKLCLVEHTVEGGEAQEAIVGFAMLFLYLVLHEEGWQLLFFVTADETKVHGAHLVDYIRVETTVVTRRQLVC